MPDSQQGNLNMHATAQPSMYNLGAAQPTDNVPSMSALAALAQQAGTNSSMPHLMAAAGTDSSLFIS